jgi:TetR/AcrR family transcriptional regulator, cholesterol catabolism regulator
MSARSMKKPNIRSYSNNTDLIDERRAYIAKCTTPLLIKQGYDRTTIRDIAKACKMSMGHLYYYIGSKEDIFQIVIDYDTRFFTNVGKSAKRYDSLTPTKALAKVIDEYFHSMVEAAPYTGFYYQEWSNLGPELRQRIHLRESLLIKEFENLLRRGCEAGEFKIPNLTVAANNIIMLGHMWVLRKRFMERGFPLDDYIRCETELILRSISAIPPKASTTKLSPSQPAVRRK